ncbi:HAD-IIIC family phosphatase [Fodinicola feengrottensis]|uniref:HAD-IIIC family phosphatase n=1 Tax=Fodinicola feengrottensis TaxID=435914 RepID=A0ABN2FQJ4_9ACTN|nr:HAD-IIIC family phosphatase [Fodinicola feengrottensis]
MTELVKCVVWDLDDTVWNGVLLENDAIHLRLGVVDTVRELDRRGILQSIASRNDGARATAALRDFGLSDYFLVPQLGWGAKSGSVRRIAEELSIGLDTLLFVDDDPVERAEVASTHPDVRVADADIPALLTRPDLTPAAVTGEGRRRRLMYHAEFRRRRAEQDFTGPAPEFLASLQMNVTIRRAALGDLDRAEELTVRTNQLNATGYPYSRAELAELASSAVHDLIVVELSDRFGSYGIVGLALLTHDPQVWTVKLLLMSCRVSARGIGTVLLHDLITQSQRQKTRLRGEFVPTPVNRPMRISYRLAGFRAVGSRDGVQLLEHHGTPTTPAPHVTVSSTWSQM